ncbi:HNH endonuclease signature motif containing protein [Nesterenkonia haasae]|uniref:HNH endonuclease signature motif containing protein n=1 Tax=Nesterenkonia haasae TaxID=2587813 RepID=UPI002E2A8D44|nr:HNH endonuclease signature motif containing protein [Nesterenkonia haasae]
MFRDGTCQAPGCTVAAQCCDIDHQHPWEAGGETTGENLWALCRRHHRMKSHGHLTPPPPTRGNRAQSPPRHRPPPTRHHQHSTQKRPTPAPTETAQVRATMIWASIPIKY